MERLSELPMVTVYQPNLYDLSLNFFPFEKEKKKKHKVKIC